MIGATQKSHSGGFLTTSDTGDQLGRTAARDQFNIVCDMLGQEAGPSIIAKATGLSRQTVYRIKDDRVGVEAILAEWGM